MGVHDFTSIFTPSESEVTFTDKTVISEDYAIDAYPEMFRGTAMQNASKLVNPQGEPTMHLTVALANACKRKALGNEDIWCFDSRDPRAKDDSKQKTLADRATIRKSNMDEIKKIEGEITKMEKLGQTIKRADLLQIDPTFDITLTAKQEQLGMLRARNPDARHFSNMIRDVMFILKCLGIQQAVAPVGCDAEKLASQLCREGLVDGVITVDTDTLVYGAPKQIKKIAGKTGKYDVYTLKDILKRYELTRTQLAQVASVMGCDFCEKTAGVGAKTVIKRVKEEKITYTAEQLAAQKKFLDREPVKYDYVDAKCTNKSLDELKDWLVKVQGFSHDGVEKKLKLFYK